MAKVSTTAVKLSRNFSEQKLTICFGSVNPTNAKLRLRYFQLLSPGECILQPLGTVRKNQRFSVAPEAEVSGLSGGDSGTRAVIPLASVIV